jgi:hypothetical protein
VITLSYYQDQGQVKRALSLDAVHLGHGTMLDEERLGLEHHGAEPESVIYVLR